MITRHQRLEWLETQLLDKHNAYQETNIKVMIHLYKPGDLRYPLSGEYAMICGWKAD